MTEQSNQKNAAIVDERGSSASSAANVDAAAACTSFCSESEFVGHCNSPSPPPTVIGDPSCLAGKSLKSCVTDKSKRSSSPASKRTPQPNNQNVCQNHCRCCLHRRCG